MTTLATNSTAAAPTEGLSNILNPKSIAIIGASDSPGNLGARAMGFMKKFSYPGKVWPVNPGRTEVAGLPCYPNLAALPGTPDLVILSVNSKLVTPVIRDCVKHGVFYGVVFAGGFGEGGEEGDRLQRELIAACRETGFKLVGPNTVGVVNFHVPAIASFGANLTRAEKIIPGNIAAISQSGGTAVTAHTQAQHAGFGFRYLVSVGNEAVLDIADFIKEISRDSGVKIIMSYLEGARNGEKIADAFATARDAGKLFVLLKAGTTEASAKAAAAHTGSLAGAHRVWQAIFDEYGIITVQTAREMLEVSLYLSGADLAKMPKGPGTAVVTLGGERGAVAADLGARNGLTIPALSAETRKKLAATGLRLINDGNPVDFSPEIYQQGLFKQLGDALDAIAADPAVHTVMINDVYNDAHADPAFAETALKMADAVIAFTKRTSKAVMLSWSPDSKEAANRLAAAGFYAFAEPERAVMTTVKLLPHGDPAKRRARPPRPQPVSFDWSKFVPAPKPGQVISEHECHRMLSAAGLPVAAGRLITSADEAVKAGQDVGYPVAMKGITPKITHRAAAGLLALNVDSDAKAREVFERHSARGKELDAPLDGVYMQHMESGKLEILVSALVDPVFGIMVTCGAGGVLTETIDDVSIMKAPFDKDAAREMLQRLRIVKRAPKIDSQANLDRLAEFVAQFSRIAASAPWKNFIIEVNPVKWRSDKVVAVDGLLVIEEP